MGPLVLASLLTSLLTFGTGGGSDTSQAPFNNHWPEIAALDYPNNGTTSALSGTATTLTAIPGAWTNSLSLAYKWHTVNDQTTALGTGLTLTVDTAVTPALVGQALEVDETACNLAGCTTRTSYWFGPIETSVPVKPHEYELDNPVPTSVPLPVATDNAHFLQCYGPVTAGGGPHVVYQGGVIPPCSPNLGTSHVWYFDPINGRTQTQMTTNSDGLGVVTTGNQGHVGHPFLDLTAFCNGGTGYSSVLWRNVIPAGDTVYLEPGNSSHPQEVLSCSGIYNTSSGTDTGTIAFTWIMGDPAAAKPVIPLVRIVNGGSGFILKNFNVEVDQFLNTFPSGDIALSSGGSSFLHDTHLEGLHVANWAGHSEDDWRFDHYPTTGGHSRGTVTEASPDIGVFENYTTAHAVTGSNPINSTVITTTTFLNPPDVLNYYVWSPWWPSGGTGTGLTPILTGIPNGTKVVGEMGVAAASFNYLGFITGAVASDVTPLTLRNTGGIDPTTSASLPAGPDLTGYWLVAANSTSLQSVYTWNTGTSTWTSLGTIPPQTPATNATYWTTKSGGVTLSVIHWNGSSFTNLGNTYSITIAPCDATTDAATGCPSAAYKDPVSGTVLSGTGHDNIPGCDPWSDNYIPGTLGGCPSGVPVAWNGLTRALTTNDAFVFTTGMKVLPSGYYNTMDWGMSAVSAIHIAGALDTAGSVDPSHPNHYVGVTNIGLKDLVLHYVGGGLCLCNVTNSYVFNTVVRWVSQDLYDSYSTNRVGFIHDLGLDTTYLNAHQDGIQWGDTNGRGTNSASTDNEYGQAAMDNEFYQDVDASNPFPRFVQGINTTEHSHWGFWAVNNVLSTTTNHAILIAGKNNIIEHNTVTDSPIQLQDQTKAGIVTPLDGVLANNVGTGVGVFAFTNYCSVDATVVVGNVSIPFANSTGNGVTGGNSQTYCTIAGVAGAGGAPGVWHGIYSWSPGDFRSGNVGVSPLFKGYYPFAVDNTAGVRRQSCPQGDFPWVGGCSVGDQGSFNMRPDTTFSGIDGSTILASVTSMFPLPQTGTIGEAYVLSQFAACFGGQASWCGPAGSTYQPGLLLRIGNSLTDATLNWAHTIDPLNSLNYILPPFTPKILHAGGPVGSGMDPIADHAGHPYDATHPSAGAYEQFP